MQYNVCYECHRSAMFKVYDQVHRRYVWICRHCKNKDWQRPCTKPYTLLEIRSGIDHEGI